VWSISICEKWFIAISRLTFNHDTMRSSQAQKKTRLIMHIIQLENILLSDQTPQAIVKIADFGLARFFADNSELRTVCGSPLYVAPEILDIGMSSETYTPAVDMWSVGVILFILLSGNSPFENEDEQV